MTTENSANVIAEIDGRKVISVSASGVNVTLETGEQAARSRLALAEAEMAEIKLSAQKKGITVRSVFNPGPIIR